MRLKGGRLPFSDLAQRQRALDRRTRGRIDRHDDQVLAQGDEVAGRARDLRQGQLGRAFEDQHGLRVAVVKVVRDLARLEQHVQRHDDRADLQNRVVRDRKVRRIRTRQRDVIARPEPQRPQSVRDLIGQGVYLLIRQRPRPHDDRRTIGRQASLVVQQVRQIEGGGGHGGILRDDEALGSRCCGSEFRVHGAVQGSRFNVRFRVQRSVQGSAFSRRRTLNWTLNLEQNREP